MIDKHKVLAITLARGGSKRVPKKNIVLIEGKPLLEYTVSEVKKSKYIDEYIISTEDEEIKKVCNNLNVKIHNRPNELAQDTTTSAAAILDVLNSYNDYDLIVEIMNTNPLKEVNDIDGCIEKLFKTKSDSVVSVVRIWDNHPSRVKYIENDTLNDFYPEIPESRRQDLVPPAYVRNGSIYAFWKKSFIKYNNRLGLTCRPFIMPSERTINIDEPEDLELAKIMIKKKNKSFNYTEYCSKLDGGCGNEW